MSSNPFLPRRHSTLACALVCIATATPLFAQPIYTARDVYTLGEPAGFSGVVVLYQPPGSVLRDAVVGFGSGAGTGFNTHALLWNGSSAPLDLNPEGYRITRGNAIGEGNRQVGQGRGPVTGFETQALLWNGSAASAVNLHPAGWISSFALGIGGPGGSQQVGYGTFVTDVNNVHALLWTGSAASFIDLHPTSLTGFTHSGANSTDGTTQVGFAHGPGTSGLGHAMLWRGTAASAVDLHPTHLPGIDASQIYSTTNGQQVGMGANANIFGTRALVWNGTAASAVDLTPSWLGDFVLAEAYASNGFAQIGFGNGTGTERADHALIWFGSADAHIDLHQLLPSNFVSSRAMSFDTDGDIFGLAIDTAGDTHLVEWDLQEGTPPPNVPLPPAALAALACLPLFQKRALRRRRGTRA